LIHYFRRVIQTLNTEELNKIDEAIATGKPYRLSDG
jgi:hypothetical protein